VQKTYCSQVASSIANRSPVGSGVVYISNLENHPGIVAEPARNRTLLGNPPEVLRCVRDWRTLGAFCRRNHLSYPTTLLQGEEGKADPAQPWLFKPLPSGGGHGIRRWVGEPLDKDHFLQRFVPGKPASSALVADGQRCVVLGLAEQFIGRRELGQQADDKQDAIELNAGRFVA
jgi:predicted ATP-grasp superfamily ATP-dependent carboligase